MSAAQKLERGDDVRGWASAVTVRKLSKEAHLWGRIAVAGKSLYRLTRLLRATGREEMKVHEIVQRFLIYYLNYTKQWK